jgi:TrmH family RNA methyltransferase
MLSKPKVKYIQSLSHKKQRDEDGVYVAEGPKIINELLAAPGVELEELYALPGILDAMALAGYSGGIRVDEKDLERISFLSTPNQVLAIFKKPAAAPLELKGHLSLMLDGIQDPGNMGSIIRCADWFGIRQIICSRDCADAYGPKTIQSTMGSIARISVWYEDLSELLSVNPDIGVYAATLAGRNLYEMDPLSAGIIVIGNESKGIGQEILELSGTRVTIPRLGQAESLNAAVATGIILSHLIR